MISTTEQKDADRLRKIDDSHATFRDFAALVWIAFKCFCRHPVAFTKFLLK